MIVFTGSTVERDLPQGRKGVCALDPIPEEWDASGLQKMSSYVTYLGCHAVPEAWMGPKCVDQGRKSRMALASVRAPEASLEPADETCFVVEEVQQRDPLTDIPAVSHHSVWPLASHPASLGFPW